VLLCVCVCVFFLCFSVAGVITFSTEEGTPCPAIASPLPKYLPYPTYISTYISIHISIYLSILWGGALTSAACLQVDSDEEMRKSMSDMDKVSDFFFFFFVCVCV
jgi:hypothetical protein